MKITYNIFSQFYNSLFLFILLPILNKSLSTNNFIYIGYFLTISGLINLFDFGFSNSIVKTAATKKKSDEILKYLYSILIYFLILFLIIESIILLSSLIYSFYYNNKVDYLLYSVLFSSSLMKFIENFIKNYFLGLNKQKIFNTVNNIFVSFKLIFFYFLFYFNLLTNIYLFFLVSTILSFLFVFILLYIDNKNKVFQQNFTRIIFDKYSLKLYLLNLISVIWKQIDQVIIIFIISKKIYADYILANNFSNIIFLCTTPILSAFYADLIHFKTNNFNQKVEDTLSKMNLMIIFSLCIIILPIILLPEQYMYIWLMDFKHANNISDILIYILLLSIVTSLLQVPFSYYSFNENIDFIIKLNFISLIFMIPILVKLTLIYGILGAIITKIFVDIIRLFLYFKKLTNDFSSTFFKNYLFLIFKNLLIPLFFIFLFKKYFYIINSNNSLLKILISIIIITSYLLIFNFKKIKNEIIPKKIVQNTF